MREAVERAEREIIDAGLGGGVIKQRVARTGQGRSSALPDTAEDFHNGGILADEDYAQITMRHLGEKKPEIEPLSGEENRAIRERANMSRAVFALHLNVTVGYISQLERGVKRPTGAALALPNVIRRKGMEVLL